MMQADDRYDKIFRENGSRFGFAPELLKAQVQAESNFDPNAISEHGAKGLAQFMDPTFREWAVKLGIKNPDPFNPEHAIAIQAGYLHWLLQKTGDLAKALAAYNWGIGHILKHLDDPNWRDALPDETRHYVERILSALR